MTEEAKGALQDFYVQARARGADEDAPVPFPQEKLETLVRLAEASARVRLSDTVEKEDADRATSLFRYCMEEIGMDPETGEFDADVIETGVSKSQRDRDEDIRHLITGIEEEYDEGAPVDVILERAEEVGIDQSKAQHEVMKLKQQGEVYEPRTDHLRLTASPSSTPSFEVRAVDSGFSLEEHQMMKQMRRLIVTLEEEFDEGVPVDEIIQSAKEDDMEQEKIENAIENLKQMGEAYEPRTDHLGST